MAPSSWFHRVLLCSGFIALSIGACTDRAQGEDEIAEACEASCPLQFECGFASEGNTLEKCLADCPEHLRNQRAKCRAGFEVSVCIGNLSCSEYDAYLAEIDRIPGTIGEPPEFPCQMEVVTAARECSGIEDP